MGAVAAIHPGRVLQCFDHFVADLRGDGGADGAGAYFASGASGPTASDRTAAPR